jgi:hypothetical protein
MEHEWVTGFDPLANWISDEQDIKANSGNGRADAAVENLYLAAAPLHS